MRRLRLLALMLVGTVAVSVRGDEPAVGVPSEITAKCTAFLNKVNAARRKELDKRMADEIADVAKVTGLDAEGVKKLEAAAVTAEDAAQADLLTKAVEMYAKAYAKAGGRGIGELEKPGVVEAASRSESGFDTAVHYTHALDQTAWTDALAHTLTPEQAAAWQKSRDAKLGPVSKEFEDMLDRQEDQVRTTLSSPMFTRSTEIIDTLGLPKDRADAVTALAKKAIDASMDGWRKEARKMFLANDETTRTRLTRGMPFYSAPQEENAPENQAVWTQGIAKLLSADDRAKLESSHGTQRKRRTHALAMLMLTIMDEKVAFTTSQRPKLEPIMERLVQGVEEFYPQADNNNDYFNLSPSSFYKAAAAAKADELRPVLDDLQWNHWQEASHDKAQSDEDEEEVQPSPTPAKTGADAIEEPEDLEQLVSDYLSTKSAVERKELDTTMLLQAEDAARIAALPPDTAARLRTAAHGAAEIALANWSSSLEQSVRSQIQGATRESVQQRLGNMRNYYFGQPTPKEQAVWKQAMKTDLTQPQQDAWQAERDARAQYSDDAITQFLLAEFDRNFVLTPDQWERLAPILSKTLRDYRPDIGRMFSNNNMQWFLTSYYMFLPLHAIPEADCKAIIGPERYDRWVGSNGYRYSVQYWSNLKEYHEQRVKEAKK